MKISGCHSCPFYVPDTGAAYLCRHPALQPAQGATKQRMTNKQRVAARKEASEFNALLEAAQLRVTFPSGWAVYGKPTDDRPGYPDVCPLLGAPLVMTLKVG